MEENEQVAEQEQAIPVGEKARVQGWVPKEEFRGDPEKWVDADKFVERGEKTIPILKERNDHLVKEIQGLKSTFGEFVEYSKKAEERAFTRAMKELQDKKEAAVEVADTDTFRAIEKEQLDLMKTRQEMPTVKPVSDIPPDFKSFVEKNDWYNTDPEMKAYADNMGRFIKETRGHLSYPEILQEVEKETKQRFASKFQNTRREQASTVEGVSETGIPRRAGGKSYSDLPAEAKAACEKFEAKIPGFTKEQYLKDYEWE